MKKKNENFKIYDFNACKICKHAEFILKLSLVKV